MSIFSENELDKMQKFKQLHFELRCYSKTRSSTKFKITLTGTGIGVHVKIKCCNCGDKLDVTDYESW